MNLLRPHKPVRADDIFSGGLCKMDKNEEQKL